MPEVSSDSRPLAGAEDHKSASAMFASGVTIVTTRLAEQIHGITVSGFASLSLSPVQVVVLINRSSRLHEMIVQSGYFAVSILADNQRRIAEYFAVPGRTPAAEFGGISHRMVVSGCPILNGSLAYFDCALKEGLAGGDHSLFVGSVLAAGASGPRKPLVYFNRQYRGVHDLDGQ